MPMADDTIKVTPGSGNVFADLGFDNPEEELRRAAIIREVRGFARAQGYDVEIAFDEAAGHFHGEVVGIRDVITFQGRTAAELCDALLGSVADYQAFRHRIK